MKNRRLWILFGGLAVLSAAFLLLNFHAAVSDTRSENNITTVSIDQGKPVAVQRREKITLVVVGEDPLGLAVEKTVLAELRKAGIGEIELARELKPFFGSPVWVVKVNRPGTIWTPFYASSQVSIHAGFASSGDTTTFLSDPPGTIDNRNGPALSMSAKYSVKDRSWGILSRPGYDQILADWVARQVVEATKQIYE